MFSSVNSRSLSPCSWSSAASIDIGAEQLQTHELGKLFQQRVIETFDVGLPQIDPDHRAAGIAGDMSTDLFDRRDNGRIVGHLGALAADGSLASVADWAGCGLAEASA